MKKLIIPDWNEASLQRERYVRATQTKIDRLSEEIDRLAVQCKQAGHSACARLEPRMVDLRNKQRVASWRLDEVQAGALEQWTDMKAGADMAVIILSESYKKVLSLVKSRDQYPRRDGCAQRSCR